MSLRCPHCKAEIKSSDIFCPFCGQNTKTSTSESSAATKNAYSFEEPIEGSVSCGNCGSLNKSGTQFCSSCGADLLTGSSYESRAPGQGYGSQSYGAATDTQQEEKRAWYKPPKRERSAKHPREWFFWTGWGLYVFLRAIFWILILVIRVVARSRK